MKIVVKNLQKKIKINPVQIRRIARKIACPAKFNNLELGLYFVKNNIIKKINKQFFKKNCLTDVISFLLDDNSAEVFIAPSVAKNNSTRFKISLKEELYRCTVHGILHIFGYRDKSRKDKSKMWKKQEDALRQIIAHEKN